MKNKIVICVILLIIVAVIVGFIAIKNNDNRNVNGENILIKMNEVTRSVFYAPQYVAINNGYFKEYGIEIDLTTGQRSRNAPNLMTTFKLNVYLKNIYIHYNKREKCR